MPTSRREFMKNSAALAVGLSLSSYASPIAAFGDNKVSFIPNFDPTGLKISRIETFTKGNNLGMVKITTHDGSTGWGQISTWNADISAVVLHRQVAHHALGNDPAHVFEIADRCIYANLKYPWSYVCRATSGIETAIWDLLGKLQGKSVCELLGGKPRPFPIYGSSMSRSISPKDEAARMINLRDEKGIAAFKFRIAKEGGRDVDAWEGRTEEIVPAIRKALGADIDLLVDANSGLSVQKAIKVANEILEPSNIIHFEEPCPYWEPEWIKEVTSSISVPVAGGEQDNDMAKWRRCISENTWDIVQPDINYIGGVSRALQVADWAEKNGIQTVPHSANRTLITIFSLHMMGALKNAGKYVEFSIEEDPWSDEIYNPVLTIDDGKVKIPDQPGWGVEIRTDWLEQCERKVTQSEK